MMLSDNYDVFLLSKVVKKKNLNNGKEISESAIVAFLTLDQSAEQISD